MQLIADLAAATGKERLPILSLVLLLGRKHCWETDNLRAWGYKNMQWID